MFGAQDTIYLLDNWDLVSLNVQLYRLEIQAKVFGCVIDAISDSHNTDLFK